MLKLLGALALLSVGAPAVAETVVVTADHMLDMGAGRTVERPAVVIVDGRITAVGTQGSVTVPKGARVVALPGKTILPGLIDSTNGEEQTGSANLLQAAAESSQRRLASARASATGRGRPK